MTRNVLAVNAAVNLASVLTNLRYCKMYSPPKVYKKVLNSVIRTIAIILVALLLWVASLCCGFVIFLAPDAKITPNTQMSYDSVKAGHAGEEVLWYINNDKYEIDISRFGYNINDYGINEDFEVYLDYKGDVIDVIPKSDVKDDNVINAIIWFGGGFALVIIVFLIIAILTKTNSRLNPLLAYYEFVLWLEVEFQQNSDTEPMYNGLRHEKFAQNNNEKRLINKYLLLEVVWGIVGLGALPAAFFLFVMWAQSRIALIIACIIGIILLMICYMKSSDYHTEGHRLKTGYYKGNISFACKRCNTL